MKKKKEWIIALRAFACVAVVLGHVIEGWTKSANITLTGGRFVLDEVIFQPLVRWSIIIFIMISGYLLLDPKKDITIDKIIQYIKKMSLVFITFVFGYCVIEYVFTYGASNIWKVFYMSLFNFIQGKSWAAMWYMYLLIGLYIITPLLRPFVKNASKREMRFVIYCLAICAYIIPTINNIFSIEITTFYLGGFKYLLLYLSGYAIANGYFEEKNIYILGIIGFISYITLSSFNILVGDNDGIFIVLFSAAVYSFFANGHYKLKNNKIIELISVDSFGIYLIHTFWLNLFNKAFHIYPDILPLFFGEMAMLIVTVILSVISVEILKRLPVFKKFL